jgi:hypothetical protein
VKTSRVHQPSYFDVADRVTRAARTAPAESVAPLDAASIQDAIKKMYGCDSRYVETVPVIQETSGERIMVEVFDVFGHATAKRAYSWQYLDGEEMKTIAVLENPAVKSASGAVKLIVVANPCL